MEERSADRAVEAAVAARGGSATRADMVVATALPEMVVERALERLLDRYVSSVQVRPGGVMVYRFARGFPRRPERRVLARRVLAAIARAGRGVARAARVGFRALLALQLLVYTFLVLLPVSVVVGVVVGIVLLVLGIFSEGGGDILAALADPVGIFIVLGVFVAIGIGWTLKRKYELLLQIAGVRELGVDARGVGGLVARVNGFALGPVAPADAEERIDRTWRISQADERRVLERVRATGGRLRAGDLVAWLGLSLDEADAQATRLAVEYGGEPVPEGDEASPVLELRFASLLPTTSADAPAEPPPPPPRAPARKPGKARRDARRAEEATRRASSPTRFERAEPPVPLTGNQPRHDAVVVLFAVVNLAGGLVASVWLGPRRGDGAWWWLAWLAGSALPVGFSVLLLALPVLRYPLHVIARARRAAARLRAAFVTALVEHVRRRGDDGVRLDALADGLTPSQARAIALELGGSFDLDSEKDPTATVWRFHRLAAELRTLPSRPSR